jgi:hypothetical protein
VNATGLLHPLRPGDVRPLGVFHGHAVFQLTLGHDDDSFRQPRVDGRSGQALPDEEILRRLVALNAERAEAEKRGLIRWLRAEFQNPTGQSTDQGALGITGKTPAGKARKAEKLAWPKTLAEQARAVRSALAARPKPATAAELCKQFKSAKAGRVSELLATLAALGQARPVGGERYVA